MSADNAPLSFTGERFHPELEREIAYEHWHRYAFAQRLVAGRSVLDAACGEGYGSALLAGAAASVIGVDLSAAAIAHARARYEHPRIRFIEGDVCRLDGIASASIDVAVSFETLEHLADHDGLLASFRRVLKPEGLLLISTPDKRTYSDDAGYANPHHVRELYRDQFEALLARHFPAYRLYGQRVTAQSSLWSLDGSGGDAEAFTQVGDAVQPGMRAAALYHLAVCATSAEALAGLPALSTFTDVQQSVMQHHAQAVSELLATDRFALALRQRLRDAGLPDGP